MALHVGLSVADDQPPPGAENFQFKAQATYIAQHKPSFSAPYSGDYSLLPRSERGNTATATLYAGIRGWEGSEFYFNWEASQARAFSNLSGLGGLSDSENQKGNSLAPKTYKARYFLRQTWNLGGEKEQLDSDFNQMAGLVDKRRVVLTAGKMAVIDLFDNNAYSHDGRTQFLNWALLTHGAFDFAADVKGYSVGATLELYYDNWAARFGRYQQPSQSNGPKLDGKMLEHYGDQLEIEHSHMLWNQPGTVHLLLFHNRAEMGGFSDAVAFAQANGGTPDVANVRKLTDKYGWGVALEQRITDDIGAFLRISRNDGESETFAFTEIERSISGGLSIAGKRWSRPDDTVGVAIAVNGLSDAHRQYIALGGHGAFIGDLAINTTSATPGKLAQTFNYDSEQIFELYYDMLLAKSRYGTVHGALNYQHIENPAYNADRGPVDFYGYRLHYEY